MPRTPTAGPATDWACPICKNRITLYVPAAPGDVVCNGNRKHASTNMTTANKEQK